MKPTWKISVDSVHNLNGSRIGVVMVDHDGNYFEYAIKLDFQATNNVSEYDVATFEAMEAKKSHCIVTHA